MFLTRWFHDSQAIHIIKKAKSEGYVLVGRAREHWRRAMFVLQEMLGTEQCHEFHSEDMKDIVVCCYVLAHEEEHGLCILKAFVLKPNTHLPTAIRTKVLNLPVLSRAGVYAADVPELINDVMYIDLFAVPCKPRADSGLCSEYVRFVISLSLFQYAFDFLLFRVALFDRVVLFCRRCRRLVLQL